MSEGIAPEELDTIAAWFHGKLPEELEVIEVAGRRLYAESIKRRDHKTGKLLETPVLLRVPSTNDKMLAAIDALNIVKEAVGKDDINRVDAALLIGGERLDEVENMCLISRCLFDPEHPDQRAFVYSVLVEAFDQKSLHEIWERFSFYLKAEDPRINPMIGDEQVLALAASIERRRSLGPLAAIAGDDQHDFFISMACLLMKSRTPKSSSPSSATLPPKTRTA